MFTGIIEQMGLVRKIEQEGTNVHVYISTDIANELKVDQSVAHNGVCLTITKIEEDTHCVTAIEETLKKSNIGFLKVGDEINLERAMKLDARLDGHIVQGHVDTTAKCIDIKDKNGSWEFEFSFKEEFAQLVIDKGSICVNGVSLTVVNPTNHTFKVAIIPYTYEHTTFRNIAVGSIVNIEFDIIGKYIMRSHQLKV
ncbi:MAG: riboflavin synthase [Saprospiraceae bacterium]|nr:riboflavin synthase [Saprospiraceae bacterium]